MLCTDREGKEQHPPYKSYKVPGILQRTGEDENLAGVARQIWGEPSGAWQLLGRAGVGRSWPGVGGRAASGAWPSEGPGVRRPGPGRRRGRAGGVGGAGLAASGAWPPGGRGVETGGAGAGAEAARASG